MCIVNCVVYVVWTNQSPKLLTLSLCIHSHTLTVTELLTLSFVLSQGQSFCAFSELLSFVQSCFCIYKPVPPARFICHAFQEHSPLSALLLRSVTLFSPCAIVIFSFISNKHCSNPTVPSTYSGIQHFQFKSKGRLRLSETRVECNVT